MNTILLELEKLRGLSGNTQIDYLNSVKSPLLKEVLEYTYDTHKKYKIDEGKYDRIQVGGLFSNNPTKEDLTVQDWYEFRTILNNLSFNLFRFPAASTSVLGVIVQTVATPLLR